MAEVLSSLAIELGLSAEGVEAGFAKVTGSATVMANRVGRELDKMQLGLKTLGKTAAEVELAKVTQKLNQNDATEQQRNKVAEFHQQRVNEERIASINGIIDALDKERRAIGKTANELKIEEMQTLGATEAQIKHAMSINSLAEAYNKRMEAASQIKGVVAALEQEASALGKTANQLQLEELRTKGATDAQIRHVESLNSTIEAYNKKAQATAEIDGVAAALEREANALGKTSNELKIEELRSKGATEAQIKHVESLNSSIEAYNKKAQATAKIDGLVGALEREANALGKTAQELQNEEMRANGATEAEIRHAEALNNKIDSYNRTSEAKASVDSLIASLENEANALGKTASELKIEELRAKGATEAQIKHAEALSKKIGIYNRVNGAGSKYLATLKSLAGIAIGGMGVQSLIKASDDWTGISNKLKMVTKDSTELAKVQKELVNIATSTGQSLSATSDLYSKFAQSQKSLGLTQKEMLSLTQSVGKAMKISGASTADAQRALVQFSQGLSKGKFDMQDMKSILSQSPALAKYIADGMGVSVDKLTELITQGKVTAQATTDALQKVAGQIDQDFAGMELTITEAFENVKTKFTEFIGQTGETSGAVKALSTVIQGVANHMDLLVGGVGALLALKGAKWFFNTTRQIALQAAALQANTLAYIANTRAAQSNAVAQGQVAVASATATTSLKGFNGIAAASNAKLALLTVGLYSAWEAWKVLNKEAQSTAAYDLLNKLTGFDNKTASFGTSLADRLNNDMGRIDPLKAAKVAYEFTPIGSLTKQVTDLITGKKAKVKIEIEAKEEEEKRKSNVTGFLEDLSKLSTSLAEEADKYGKTAAQIREEDTKSLIAKMKAADANEEEIKAAQNYVDTMKASADKMNAIDVSNYIKNLEEQGKRIGLSGERLIEFELSLKSATTAQIEAAKLQHKDNERKQKREDALKSIDELREKINNFNKTPQQIEVDKMRASGVGEEEIKEYKRLSDIFDGMQAAKDGYQEATNQFGTAAQTFKDGIDLWSKSADFRAGYENQSNLEKGLPVYSSLGDNVKALDKTIADSAERLKNQLANSKVDNSANIIRYGRDGKPLNKPMTSPMEVAAKNAEKNVEENKKDMGSLEIKFVDGTKSVAGKIFGEEVFVDGMKQFFNSFIHENARAIEN